MFAIILLLSLSASPERKAYVWTGPDCGACVAYKRDTLTTLYSEGWNISICDYRQYQDIAKSWNIRVLPTTVICRLENNSFIEIGRFEGNIAVDQVRWIFGFSKVSRYSR